MAASSPISYLLAAEATAEIVSQKLEILLCDPVCDSTLSMETRVMYVKVKLALIQEFLSTQYIPSETTNWWRRFLRAMYYAEEFIDKFHFREARGRHKALRMATRPLAALVSKYMLWRDLSYLVNDMDELCRDKFLTDKEEAKGEKPTSVPYQGEKFVRLSIFWRWQERGNYLCRVEKNDEIMKQIGRSVDSNLQAISILGKHGVGKTFLARWVYREARYRFEWRAWVHVSTCMNRREFLLEILKQVENLPMEEEDMDIEKIEKILYQKSAKKTFLIVLDDVHASDEPLLRQLVMIIPLCLRGLIITTTEDAGIARTMNSFDARPIELTDLSDEQSKMMLAMKLNGVPRVRSLTQEENNILKRCPGSPLCISLLGGLLSNAGEQGYKALSKDSFQLTLSDILQLSYERLPVYLKLCFIYMALFPVASVISTRRLVRLWLAEGLLDAHCYDGERKWIRPPEEVGEMFILELADRNVIEVVGWRADGSPKACQMLNSLRPIAMSIGFIHIHAAIHNSTGQQQLPAQLLERTKVRWLAEHTNIVTDSRNGSFPDLYLSHISSFLSFYLRRGILTEDISTFLRNMTSKTTYNLLRVLDLEGMYKPSLQGVLHELVLLRYLGLRRTVLGSLPSTVADLHYLETLDVKHTNITSLPSSFWRARNLRHLYLNWFYINLENILKAGGNNVMALTKLQTLSGLVIGEVKENLMTGNVNSLTTLTTLKLFMQESDSNTSGAAWVTVANWISFKLTNLQSLTFGVIKKAKPAKEGEPKKEANPATSQISPLPKLSLAEKHHKLLELYLLGQLNKPIWPQLLPGSLLVLTLSCSKVVTDEMPQLGGLLRYLRTLRLLANSFLSESMRFVNDGFPSLTTLKIWKLPQLKEVIIEQGAMRHLKELEFRHLKRLETVEWIDHCTELETICVRSQSDALVNKLQGRIGEKNLHVEIDTKRPGSTDDDEDDRDEKGKMLHLHVEKDIEVPISVDDDDRDEKGEMPHPHVEKDIKVPVSVDDDDNDDEEAYTSP